MSNFEGLALAINGGGFATLIFIQWKIISGYNAVFKSTDIKRLSVYYEDMDRVRSKTILSQVSLTVDTTFKELYAVWGKQYDELATFACSILEVLPKEDQQKFIDTNFIACKKLFRDYLNKSDEANDVSHNDREKPNPS